MTTQQKGGTVPRFPGATPFLSEELGRALPKVLGSSWLVTRTLKTAWDAAAVIAIADFSDASFEWVSKCVDENAAKGTKIVLLLQADTETIGGQLALRKATSVLFVIGKQIANRPTMLVGFDVDLSPLGWLGAIVSVGKLQPVGKP